MRSGLSPALLSIAASLPLGLASLLLCCDRSLVSLDSSPFMADLGFSPPFHEGMSHTTPVKLFRANGFLPHLRQGAPDRSRARRPALIAPWLALGPSLCEAPTPLGLLAWWRCGRSCHLLCRKISLRGSRMMVPSVSDGSLPTILVSFLDQACRVVLVCRFPHSFVLDFSWCLPASLLCASLSHRHWNFRLHLFHLVTVLMRTQKYYH